MLKAFIFIFLILCSSFAVADESREVRIKEYLHDFVGHAFKESFPNINQAIEQVIKSLPQEVLDKVLDPDFPVLFIEMPHYGGGRWANSNGIYMEPDDPPTFTKGVWIVKLSTELNDSNDIPAIEGVIAHEIAHFVLGHQPEGLNLKQEKEANALVNKWGLEEQFLKAKKRFGGH